MREKFKCNCCFDFRDDTEQYIDMDLVDDEKFWETEMAWLFYESGIVDMREEKQLSVWFNNRGIR